MNEDDLWSDDMDDNFDAVMMQVGHCGFHYSFAVMQRQVHKMIISFGHVLIEP